MANLQDLKKFADDILPSLKALFSAVTSGASAAQVKGDSLDAVAALKKLIAESSQPTAATNTEAAAAVTDVRVLLFNVLSEAAKSDVALAETDVNTINVLFTALEDRAGRLLQMAAFAGIPRLISADDLVTISANIQQAEAEIRQRQQAKQILDAVVKTVIVAAQIASKIAA
jgi:uncharacterized protein YPO0396